jgi:hypothetical protein
MLQFGNEAWNLRGGSHVYDSSMQIATVEKHGAATAAEAGFEDTRGPVLRA